MDNPTNMVKVKKATATVKDIQINLKRIQAAKDKAKVGTPEFERLTEEEEKEIMNLKKLKEASQFMAPKDAIVIGGTALLAFFAIALNREWPTAVKTAATILKFIPFKG